MEGGAKRSSSSTYYYLVPAAQSIPEAANRTQQRPAASLVTFSSLPRDDEDTTHLRHDVRVLPNRDESPTAARILQLVHHNTSLFHHAISSDVI